MRPNFLMKGDLILYKGVDWLGNTIDFFSHGPICHIACVYDDTRLIRQNPGGIAYEKLSDAPWDHVIVKRLSLAPLKAVGIPGPAALDPRFGPAFDIACKAHEGDIYNYPEIFLDALAGINEYAGLGFLATWDKELAAKFLALHLTDCANFCRSVLEVAVRDGLDVKDFSLLGSLEGGEEPVDFLQSPCLVDVI